MLKKIGSQLGLCAERGNASHLPCRAKTIERSRQIFADARHAFAIDSTAETVCGSIGVWMQTVSMLRFIIRPVLKKTFSTAYMKHNNYVIKINIHNNYIYIYRTVTINITK